MHPGGVQLVGDVLVVPMDKKIVGSDPDFLVLFIDVSNPEVPRPMSRFAPANSNGSPLNTTVVGLTPVANPNGPGVRYLMIAAGGDNSVVTFWRSLPTAQDGSTDLKSVDLDWERVGGFTERSIEICMGGFFTSDGLFIAPNDWPTSAQDPYQTLNFVREESGDLYLIGANNELLSDRDLLDLYRVNVNAFGVPDPDCPLTIIANKHVTSKPIMGGGDSANFAAASGVYVSPSGELIVYGAEYENDGPRSVNPDGTFGRQTVRFGEWRHREMVRPNSPTLQPNIEVGELFQVDEGSVLPLSAQTRGPTTKAWIQFFEDAGLGLSLAGIGDSDEWLAVDYEDWGKDNFDNFVKLDFNNQADSMRWFAPVGCTLRVNQGAFGDADFPGLFSKTLRGTGEVEAFPDLDDVRSDNTNSDTTIGDTISSMEFFPDCDAYYNSPIGVAWDLNNDGTFETTGVNTEFPATNLDGPAVHVILARAQHPTDQTFLGQSAPKPIRIEVRNVHPRIESFALVDFLGVPVPFALLNLEYAAEGTFTDPGKPDRQTATLNWDDGTIEENTAFDLFSDAFGGATGQFGRRHTFTASGLLTVQVRVRDDDGGETEASVPVRVLSPLEALQLLLEETDALLASATKPGVIKALREARANLDGNNGGTATDGAIDKLDKNDPLSALVKISAFVSSLTKAEAAGVGDLGALMYFACFIAESIAQAEYLRVVAALPAPSSGQARQILRIQQAILNGQQLLARADYLGAIDQYKDAVGRAARLP